MATEDKALEHAWAYFSLHAAQRITVFNYFVVFAGILCTGLAATMQAPIRLAFVGIALGLLLTALAFLFWKLDERTSFLIKHAEETIKRLEPSLATLLTVEVAKTDHAQVNDGLWTYGRSFGLSSGSWASSVWWAPPCRWRVPPTISIGRSLPTWPRRQPMLAKGRD